MDFGAIFSLVQKGLQLIPVLIEAGETVIPIVNKLVVLTQHAKEGAVTDEDLATLEAELDALMDSFNEPMKDEE